MIKLYPTARIYVILILAITSYILSIAQVNAQIKKNTTRTTASINDPIALNNNQKGIYPIPASDFVNVTIPNTNENTLVQIIDLAGNVVDSQTTIYNNVIKFHLSNLKDGFYMVKLFNNNENIKLYKLIKQ